MRKWVAFAVGLVLLSLALLNSCKKDDPGTNDFLLISLKSGSEDLTRNLGDTIKGVSTKYNIVAEFSSNIDFTSIGKRTISLMRDTTHIPLSYIIAGRQLNIDPLSDLPSGAIFTLEIGSDLRSLNGMHYSGLSLILETEGIGIDTPPQSGNQIVYVHFNGNAGDASGNYNKKSEQVAYTVDRFGLAGLAANFRYSAKGGTGDIVELAPIDSIHIIPASMTMSMWLNISKFSFVTGTRAVLGLAADRGYYFEMAGDTALGASTLTFSTNHHTFPAGGKIFHNSISSYTGDGITNDTIIFSKKADVFTMMKEGWHQVVMTYDSITSLKTMYVDGEKVDQRHIVVDGGQKVTGMTLNNTDTTGFVPYLAIGYYGSKKNTTASGTTYENAINTFVGALDDLRIFKKPFTEQEVFNLYDGEAPEE